VHAGRVISVTDEEGIMTTRDDDTEATVKMPQPLMPKVPESIEDVDPEQTLARDDWESTAIRRVTPHVKAVDADLHGESYGWETESLRRLSREVRREDAP
jgi:hypothetical protein